MDYGEEREMSRPMSDLSSIVAAKAEELAAHIPDRTYPDFGTPVPDTNAAGTETAPAAAPQAEPVRLMQRVRGKLSGLKRKLRVLTEKTAANGDPAATPEQPEEETGEGRVIQIISSLFTGDACGNEVLAVRRLLDREKIDNLILAIDIGSDIERDRIYSLRNHPPIRKNDILLYHFAICSEISGLMSQWPGKKVLVYHNVTPPAFFHGWSAVNEENTRKALEEVRQLKDCIDFCIADSEFNRRDLIGMGYECPVEVCPILLNMNDFDGTPDPDVIMKYQNEHTVNWLFVGRLAPNKKQEDILRAFACYVRDRNRQARLFLVGGGAEEPYGRVLAAYAEKLGIRSRVVITGHVTFAEMLAYYKIADLFVCLSEHEGFCIPLLEAMKARLPVMAYQAGAVPDTMGGCGVLLSRKDPAYVAAAADVILSDAQLYQQIVAYEQDYLPTLDIAQTGKRFMELITRIREYAAADQTEVSE